MPKKNEEKAVVSTRKRSPIYGLAEKFNIEPDTFLRVLKGTVIKPDGNREATNEEVAAFCVVAQQYGLNPFTGEIHAFAKGGSVVPIVGIDGWTHIVNSCGDFDGCEFEYEEGDDGKPHSVTCTMHVKGRSHPVSATEYFSECYRPTGPWNQMPRRMLRHKAYIQAGRYAFGLSGIYDADEARDIINNKSADASDREPVQMPEPIEADFEEVEEAQKHTQKAETPVGGISTWICKGCGVENSGEPIKTSSCSGCGLYFNEDPDTGKYASSGELPL